MKAAVAYFSGTGNTRRISEVFKVYLEDKNYEVDMIDISKHNEHLCEYDLFILGTPSYTKTSSFNMYDFIEKYIHKHNNPSADVITFVSYGWAPAFGHLTLRDFVIKKGFDVMGARAFLAPSNFYMYNGKKQPKQSKQEIHELYKDIHRDVFNLMDSYMNGNVQIDKASTFKKKFFTMVSNLGHDKYIAAFPATALKVDGKKCVKCGICVKQCPNGNISLENGTITFGRGCAACSRCMHICPKNAYKYMDKTFEQYDLKQKSILEQL